MASPDPKIRDRAVRTVQTFLSTKGDSLNYDEFLKLWKGFFYCFWLSDKTEGQNALAELIAKLIHNLPVEKKGSFSESGSALFIRSFWETMGREWPRLDRLRLNKYYNLMKNVLHQSFQFIAISSETEESVSWSPDLVKGYSGILVGTVFDYSNRAYPDSIRNYVIENYFELLKSSSEESFSAEMTVLVCEPIVHAVAYCENKAFFKQASESLIQGILPGDEEEEEDGSDGREELEDDEVESSNPETDEDSLDSDIVEVDQDDEESNELSQSEIEENELDEESADFDSEEFDNITHDHGDDDDCCDEEGCCDINGGEEGEEFINVFDYSLLSKFIFDFGAREDVLTRNRRFLYELSQIIEEVESGCAEYGFSSCCHDGDESCCK